MKFKFLKIKNYLKNANVINGKYIIFFNHFQFTNTKEIFKKRSCEVTH